MLHTLYFVEPLALTSPFMFALTPTILLSETLILDHILIDLCLQFLYNHLHFCSFNIHLRRFLLCLSLDLLKLLQNICYYLFILLFIICFLPTFLLSSTSFGFFQL